MADYHIFDYSKIDENIFLGSDLCKGNVCPIHSSEFDKLGVTVEINLSLERKEIPPDNMNSYVWIPVKDDEAPTLPQFNIGTAIINESILMNKIIYIHCKHGHGRSPTMLGAYLIRYKKMSTDQALNYIKKGRDEIHLNDLQINSLKEYEKICLT